MSLKILLIEDDKKKIEDISTYIMEKYPKGKLTIEKSFRDGLKQIKDFEFDILLLDMTIPKWGDSVVGGSIEYENFGGFNIMKEMKRKNRTLPTILITMFNEFGVGDNFLSLETINNLCEKQFDFYKGLVFYSSKNENWKTSLNELL